MSFEMKAETKRRINPDSGPGNLALGYPHLHPVLPKTEGRKKANALGRDTKPPMGCNRGFYLGFLMRFAGKVGRGGAQSVMKCCSRTLMKCQKTQCRAHGKLDVDYWSNEN